MSHASTVYVTVSQPLIVNKRLITLVPSQALVDQFIEEKNCTQE